MLRSIKSLPRIINSTHLVQKSFTTFPNYTPVFHPGSTRYSKSDREVLKNLDVNWKLTQPSNKPKNFKDKFDRFVVNTLADIADWYFGKRVCAHGIFVESLAALPGMIAGRLHHYRSLRRLQYNEWIRRLMDEAENERIHLYSFMELDELKKSEKALIKILQFGFRPFFWSLYMLSPYTAHRFVGYLEEAAVRTYTHMIDEIKSGKIPDKPAAKIAISYWGLPNDATLLDMLLVIRADEGDHRMVNHTAANTIHDTKGYPYANFDVDLGLPYGDGVNVNNNNNNN